MTVAKCGLNSRIALSAIGLFCVLKCGAAQPNILYILTDQWRATAFGFAGDPNVKTPQLDKLAGQSVVFHNAVSVLPGFARPTARRC